MRPMPWLVSRAALLGAAIGTSWTAIKGTIAAGTDSFVPWALPAGIVLIFGGARMVVQVRVGPDRRMLFPDRCRTSDLNWPNPRDAPKRCK